MSVLRFFNRAAGRGVRVRLSIGPKSILLVLAASVSWWLYGQGRLQAGYAVVTADVAGRLPAATALFSYTNAAGVLVSEAAVGVGEPMRSGRSHLRHVESGKSPRPLSSALIKPADTI